MLYLDAVARNMRLATTVAGVNDDAIICHHLYFYCVRNRPAISCWCTITLGSCACLGEEYHGTTLSRPARRTAGRCRGPARLVARPAAAQLESFLKPFVRPLLSPEQRANAHDYVQGLLSDLESKDVESIAYLHDRERQGLQKFIGQAPWDQRPLVTELARQVGIELGQADAVLVFDPSAFAKKGTQSVGVARQWCGRLGKLDNCQVGVYLAYVSRQEHALVDGRLYLPRANGRSRGHG